MNNNDKHIDRNDARRKTDTFLVQLRVTQEGVNPESEQKLPARLESALEYSTAREALQEALGPHVCVRSLRLVSCSPLSSRFREALNHVLEALSDTAAEETSRRVERIENATTHPDQDVTATSPHEQALELIRTVAKCCDEALDGSWNLSDEGFIAMREALEEALTLLTR